MTAYERDETVEPLRIRSYRQEVRAMRRGWQVSGESPQPSVDDLRENLTPGVRTDRTR
ncbi:hypothetical protein [Curtobacterium ammoniigenes]|uniref:hypothetical protein n=1 Tax=Curtobacterium ammoniigenes TaxID=395387 RepID=UPI000A52E9D3|nr:hypothetical protein [Curtobacterium ammoniigenes]